jgi:hypothetical protein
MAMMIAGQLLLSIRARERKEAEMGGKRKGAIRPPSLPPDRPTARLPAACYHTHSFIMSVSRRFEGELMLAKPNVPSGLCGAEWQGSENATPASGTAGVISTV